MDSLLKIESLKKYYGKKPNQTKSLDGISFQVMPGEFFGIMGRSVREQERYFLAAACS